MGIVEKQSTAQVTVAAAVATAPTGPAPTVVNLDAINRAAAQQAPPAVQQSVMQQQPQFQQQQPQQPFQQQQFGFYQQPFAASQPILSIPTQPPMLTVQPVQLVQPVQPVQVQQVVQPARSFRSLGQQVLQQRQVINAIQPSYDQQPIYMDPS